MFTRRNFLIHSAMGAIGAGLASCRSSNGEDQAASGAAKPKGNPNSASGVPVVLSTWNSEAANEAAMRALKDGGGALDAVEAGVRVEEANAANMTVGYGGLPDRDGHVTLDACIMDHSGNAGSVTFLEHIMHPVSVARKVMEQTPHVMLSGEGALQFALSQGFEKQNLLTDAARAQWQKWLKEKNYKPEVNIERHDTIGMLAVDAQGRLAGACTTSGLAFKMHGRVGDSPIIGAGLYVDGEIGGAVATGLGEFVMKTLGAFLIVELMRQGRSPQEACEEGIDRIIRKYGQTADSDFQVGYLALNPQGEHGACSIVPGFSYTLFQTEKNKIFEGKFLKK